MQLIILTPAVMEITSIYQENSSVGIVTINCELDDRDYSPKKGREFV
jgi:hypothetical protein